MSNRGYVFYDCTNPIYRPLDGTMYQFDIAFVKENGFFRIQQQYGTNEQRQMLDKRLQENIVNRLEKSE